MQDKVRIILQIKDFLLKNKTILNQFIEFGNVIFMTIKTQS